MTIKANCHRSKTKFEVSKPPSAVRRCTCSKRGTLWAYCRPAQFRLLSPPENVATCRRGSKTVKHNFCADCGCGTYSKSPDCRISTIPKVGINARLVDDFDLGSVPVTVIDGKNSGNYFRTIHAGACSLAPSSARTMRSTPALQRRGASAGLSRR